MNRTTVHLEQGNRLDLALAAARHNADGTSSRVIHLGPGEFETRGPVGVLSQLQPNTHIIGAGMDLTTVKLTDIIRESTNGYGCAFTTWHQDAPNVSVRDLTIDCNYAALVNQTGISNLSLRGAMLYGSNTVIERVRVINACGQRKMPNGSNEETFVLAVGAHKVNAHGCRISGCIVRDLIPGSYISAIALMGDSVDAAVISGEISGCRVQGITSDDHFGLNLQYTFGAVFRDNVVIGCERGIGNDTGENSQWEILSNRFYVEHGQCGMYLTSCRDALVSGNLIDCRLGGWAGTIGPGAKGLTLAQNTVRGVSDKRAWALSKGAKPKMTGNVYA